MLTSFKIYCKDMVIGATVGASVGAAAGAAAGKVGLRQVCNPSPSALCDDVVSSLSQDAVQMGAATGAAICFGIGLFFYPACKAAARWWSGSDTNSDSLASADSLRLEG